VVASAASLSELVAALGVGDHSHIALAGGGGKTTLLHALGAQLGGRVVLTTTTRMSAGEHGGRRVLLGPTDAEVLEAAGHGPVVVWAGVDAGKARGVDPVRCDAWFAGVDHVVVEADGSRGRPFKAPGPLEPVVPESSTLVVSVIGADALGRVIADQCHRPLRVAALAACRADRRLDPELAARVLLHERGTLAAVPDGAEPAIVVTKVDRTTAQLVDRLVDELRSLDRGIRIVTVGSVTHMVDHDGARNGTGSARPIAGTAPPTNAGEP
jgi:molybdenum cofactor cytidylyltransferase